MSATAEKNGAATRAPEQEETPDASPPAPMFPVDSFREAARYLRRPFAPNAVRFKVQTTNVDRGWAMIVAHIDARLVVERLNLVCPHLWSDAYERAGDGVMWCHLTVDDITRRDVGEGQRKGLVSDALKRAAVRFGIGVSLYAIPKVWLYARNGDLRQIRTRRGPSYALTDAGDRACRNAYERWLENEGIAKFGEALDHGDAADAVGDVEGAPEPEPVDDGETAETVERFLSLAMEAAERGLADRSRLLLAMGAVGAKDTSSVTRAAPTVPTAELERIASALADSIAADDEARAAARARGGADA